MWNELFVAALGALCFAYLAWGFRHLPEEKWQIFATLPQRQDAAGYWQGLNFTYYGLFSSAAQFVSVAIIFLLFGAVGVTRAETVLLSLVMLGACLPGSKIVALIVEKKSSVFSVGGAAFIGILLAPWAVLLSNATLGRLLGSEIPVLPVLAAISIGYAFGEGLGRLACISFGCCYGKPLHTSHPLVQKLFARWYFVFRGETKKIAYADNLAGEKVVPIQAVTALLYTAVGLAGMLLFLHDAYSAALLLSLAVTQLWRAFSETLRADWRGSGRFSVYQVLALVSVLYIAIMLHFLPAPTQTSASLLRGLETLWHPGMVLFLLGLWLVAFIYYGRSLVTGSRLSLYVCHDRI
jgi:prolipoprotein diacylglyceryltransferase